MTQNNLGISLAVLAERTGDRVRMADAIGCLRDAAQVYREGGNSYWQPIAEQEIMTLEAELAKMEQ